MTAEKVIKAAQNSGVMITTAESCTGGLLAAALTEIAGASRVLDRGFISYSYASKPDMLGISPDTLEAHGAVSAEAAAEMAKGALARSAADIAIAITGIAGPVTTGSKPEGLVWFATASREETATYRQDFGPIGRANVRQAAVDYALARLLKVITLPKI